MKIDGLMVMFLICKKNNPDNGVCLATTKEHIPSLTSELKSLRHLHVYGPEATDWRLIPADSEHFEVDIESACKLILKRDSRIGRMNLRPHINFPTNSYGQARRRT